MSGLKVVLIKPSKYDLNGVVERFTAGFMPNATLYHIASLTPKHIRGVPTTVHTVDEYVQGSLDYLRLLNAETDCTTLVALVGVQSHQFHRALDLAAYARRGGVRHVVIGGPHPMTCETSTFQNRGVSFALAEAELIWEEILQDALKGELQPVYGANQRWAKSLGSPVIQPPSHEELKRYWIPMMGLYPVRGCPYSCSYCSVIKISGRQVRSPSIESTLASLRRAKKAGVKMVMFVSDNFNKFPEIEELLHALIDEQLGLQFLCQCDAQVVRQPDLVELMARAGCFQMFVGIESFNRKTLRSFQKYHNHPQRYGDMIKMCSEVGIRPHFSNIIGFPDDTEKDVRHHLEILMDLMPTAASFYVLTPIPGTKQYDEYRMRGLIRENNLDRFDATYPTWAHPHISAERMYDLLFECYRKYYTALMRKRDLEGMDLSFATMSRFLASKNIHPMSGGVKKLVIDRCTDYVDLRKDLFGVEMAPLPNSLRLSSEDEMLNKKIEWKRKAIEKL